MVKERREKVWRTDTSSCFFFALYQFHSEELTSVGDSRFDIFVGLGGDTGAAGDGAIGIGSGVDCAILILSYWVKSSPLTLAAGTFGDSGHDALVFTCE
jgi:hypothetical protein